MMNTNYSAYMTSNASPLYKAYAAQSSARSAASSGTSATDAIRSLLGTSGSGKTSATSYINALFGGNSGVNADSLAYLSDVKQGGRELKSAINALSTLRGGSKTTAYSSDPDKLSASGSSSGFKDTTVKIDQIAAGQTNKSTAMASKTGFGESGLKQFEIASESGKTETFSVYVNATDTNDTVLQKMAVAVNGSRGAYTAGVTRDDKTGNSTLTVTSSATGDTAAARFSVRDTQGDLVSRTGIDTRSQAARNAIYSVNGGANVTSASNTVDLGSGVKATLKASSDKAVTVSVGTNPAEAESRVKAMTDSANKLLSAVYNNVGRGSERLFDDITGAVKTYAPALSRIGVSMGSDGLFKVDSDKLAKSARNGDVDAFLKTSSGSYGFMSRMSKVASNIEHNPSYYTNSSMNSLYNTGYFDRQSYNRYSNVGLLMNFMA